MAIAIVAGVITGFVINIEFLCSGMKDTELFEDFLFFQTPYEPEDLASEPAPSFPAFPPQSVPPPPLPITPSNFKSLTF